MEIKLENIEAMASAFVEALLWTSDKSDENGAVIEEDLRGYDVDAQSLNSVRIACADFLENLPRKDEVFEAYSGREWGVFESIGHDFLLTRNGHGAGFWDRDFIPEDLRDMLTDYAGNWVECYAFSTGGEDTPEVIAFDLVAVRNCDLS